MSETDQKPCSVFSDEEIRELRRMPWALKLIVGLFVAIVALIFMPFQTVTQLGSEVGKMSAIQTERSNFYEKKLQMHLDRIKKVEEFHAGIEKRLYWIDRNSRETNDKMRELFRQIKRSENQPQNWKLSRSGMGPSVP